MKFHGELKFPEVDHPGVPVVFVIDDDQAEIMVEGESLGRWSLYDIHARRLVASAFQIDLEGTEVTFVADDPIDFAYRGVEHMAKTWAEIKSRRVASRMVAVRKSRRGVTESRVDDLRLAMESNLEDVGPRRIAGEPEETAAPSPIDRIMSRPSQRESAAEILNRGEPETQSSPEPDLDETMTPRDDWDLRDQIGGIPLAGEGSPPSSEASEPDVVTAEDLPARAEPSGHLAEIEEERRRLAEERERFEAERLAAAQREADLLEAYKLEMQRLESEREQLRLEAAAAAAVAGAHVAEPESPRPELETPEPEPPAAETEPEPEPEALEPEPEALEPEPEPEPTAEEAAAAYVDLIDIEVPEAEVAAPPPPVRVPRPEPEPAMAGSSKDKRGIMGAVKAAFGTGTRDHTHSFVEAPGGLGITRYVCEECGYVSISTGR